MKKILVVDDSPEIRSLFQIILENEGHTLSFASSGKEALWYLHREEFDLVISDLEMSDGSGSWLLEESKKLPRPPKIVIVSGDLYASEERLKALGALALFRKPFHLNTFMRFISTVMGEF